MSFHLVTKWRRGTLPQEEVVTFADRKEIEHVHRQL